MRLLFGQDRIVADWVQNHIPHMASGFGPGAAIGIVDEQSQPMAGIVFHDYQPAYGTIQLSAAAVNPRWASKRILAALLHYPFEELKVWKVWTATQMSNVRALKFNKGVGFTQEAILKDHFGKGQNAVICRMLAKDYARLYG